MASELNVGKVTASAVTIYNDGANSFVNNATGQLFINKSGPSNCWIHGPEVGLASADGTETLFRATQNGSVKLYYDNAIKLETSATGLAVTGAVTASSTTTVNADLVVNSTLNTPLIWANTTGTGALLTLHKSGAIKVNVDNTGLATFSAGIAFQSATTGSGTGTGYKLDSYEVGIWTPVIAGGSCTNLVGKYTRVGNKVTVTVSVMSGVLSGITGTLNAITGLPFTVGNTRSMTSSIGFINLLPTGSPIGVVIESSDRIDFLYNNASASWSGANFANSTGANLHFSATYFV